MNFGVLAVGCLGLAVLVAGPPATEASRFIVPSQNPQGSAAEAERTLEEQIALAEKGIVRERIWMYQGSVEDLSGKRMHGVKIDVFKSGTGGKAPLVSTRSDVHGHFSVHLTNGNYTAVMQAQGFRPLIYIFEITYEGVEKELRFRLTRATNA